jgi:hypothetical protein
MSGEERWRIVGRCCFEDGSTRLGGFCEPREVSWRADGIYAVTDPIFF